MMKSARKTAQEYMLASGRAGPYTSVWFPQTQPRSTIFLAETEFKRNLIVESSTLHAEAT